MKIEYTTIRISKKDKTVFDRAWLEYNVLLKSQFIVSNIHFKMMPKQDFFTLLMKNWNNT